MSREFAKPALDFAPKMAEARVAMGRWHAGVIDALGSFVAGMLRNASEHDRNRGIDMNGREAAEGLRHAAAIERLEAPRAGFPIRRQRSLDLQQQHGSGLPAGPGQMVRRVEMNGDDPLFTDIYQVDVPESWTDHYGHMNEGYFVVAASDASWAFQAHLDIGTAYYDRTGCALVTVETHVRYLAEVSRGESLSFDSLVIGHDAKRLHVGHVFRVGERQCGTIECMWLHLDHRAGRTKPFSPDIDSRLAALAWKEPPEWAGRHIGLARGARR